MTTIKERLVQTLENEGIPKENFYKRIGILGEMQKRPH